MAERLIVTNITICGIHFVMLPLGKSQHFLWQNFLYIIEKFILFGKKEYQTGCAPEEFPNPKFDAKNMVSHLLEHVQTHNSQLSFITIRLKIPFSQS